MLWWYVMACREALRTVNLSKRFGGIKALDNVSIRICEGEFVGLIGPNGSGKTTLFNVISGVYKPDKGDVYLFGERVTGLPPYQLYRRGLVRSFQVPRLWKNMTVVENLAMAARNARGESLVEALFGRKKWVAWERKAWAKFKSVMSKLNILPVGLNRADNISGGQMKLTDMARALIGEARILLLDEPTAGVAPKLARDIFKLLKALNREGLTIFVIEHRLEVLFDFVERVIVMHEGRVLVEGTPQQVAEDPRVIDAYLGS